MSDGSDSNETEPLLAENFRESYGISDEISKDKSHRMLNRVGYSTSDLTNASVDFGQEFLRKQPDGPIELHRASTISSQYQKPLFHRLFSNQFTVSNANSPHDNSLYTGNTFTSRSRSGSFILGPLDQASVYSVSDPEHQKRLSIISVMRPSRLIGSYTQLCNWYDYYIEKDTMKSRKASVRNYYKEQNEIIKRLQEIDNFLDAGKIHYNMLSHYGQDSRILATHVEEDEDIDEEDTDIGITTTSNSHITRQTSQHSDLESQSHSHHLMKHKYSRFYDVPGNVDQNGSKFLGYDEEEEASQVYIAIMVNFFLNFILLIGKLIVTLLTNSISVVASLVDSILDFLSTFIIFISNKLSTSKDWKIQHAYPVGRTRLEPLGILVFSIIIIISFVQVGQEAFKRLVFSNPSDRIAAQIGLDSIAIMSITIISKIACWVWCSKSNSSSVQALAQDAETDIVFNLVSLAMPTIGFYLNIWWLDPLGAVLLSIYIIFGWSKTAFEHINNLTGAAADPLDYKVILYLAYRFAEPIKQITALKAYHVGDNLNVEIDIVFAKEEYNLSFKDCHDMAEALQYSIETLPMVERAFVHIDYMEGNYKGHLK
ncbi:putative cation diffusion facilitator [Scheffersomyces amazonensis]|uniref:putative cation diffusion facilitator n=1 Tax=Scheffersomyces amazonensis TaxID=1078765 RepID=UPI00315D1042